MEIKLLTYNLAMVPLVTGIAKRERIKAFVEEIRNHHDFDILCLQEIFDEKIRKQLKNDLGDKYPYMVEKSSDHDILNEDSGMFFASKYPFLRHTFREFHAKSSGTWDAIVDKGIFVACFKLGSGDNQRILHVYNVHLQSTESEYKTREKQLAQLRRFVERALKTEKENSKPLKVSALLLGDFNVVGDKSEEYKRMMSLLGYPIDLFRVLNPDAEGYTWNSEENIFLIHNDREDKDMERLDYIFTFTGIPYADDNRQKEEIDGVDCKSCDLFRPKASGIPGLPDECDLSDHYGVEAVIEIPV
ncbi:MAG: sphingomyelin phosphodiesterase [Candidatus Aminicenantes bacterium]|nr:MAG: sphingomyelin phosphodiesterase [Candidatus Aminicenantes bacterium]